jgi:hypothetical protein
VKGEQLRFDMNAALGQYCDARDGEVKRRRLNDMIDLTDDD